MGFKAKKFTNYVREDRLNRVQAYVEKYGSDIIKLQLDNRGRNALHLACQHGSIYCFGYLLKHKPNLMKTDHDGNLPLHWALEAAKKGERYAYTDIVLPLLKLCPASQDVPNKKGVTARQLLANMGINVEESSQHSESQDIFDPCLTCSDDETAYNNCDEMEWEAKLCGEMEEDYGEGWGRYEQDYDDEYDCEVPESYDVWAARMSHEYHQKHNAYNKPHEQESAKTNKEPNKPGLHWTPADQERFEQQESAARSKHKAREEKCKRLQQKLQFIMKYSKIFYDREEAAIRLRDLPWMDYGTSSEEILAVLLADVEQSDSVAKKRCLREQQVQWHPDKFLQKCGNRLREEDKGDVLCAVNHFSQIINAALDNMSSV